MEVSGSFLSGAYLPAHVHFPGLSPWPSLHCGLYFIAAVQIGEWGGFCECRGLFGCHVKCHIPGLDRDPCLSLRPESWSRPDRLPLSVSVADKACSLNSQRFLPFWPPNSQPVPLGFFSDGVCYSFTRLCSLSLSRSCFSPCQAYALSLPLAAVLQTVLV